MLHEVRAHLSYLTTSPNIFRFFYYSLRLISAFAPLTLGKTPKINSPNVVHIFLSILFEFK